MLQVVLVLPEPQPISCPWVHVDTQDLPSLLTKGVRLGVRLLHVVHVPGVVKVAPVKA